ncbi:hypothetical protein [Burkholderia glumae]|uniref:hypothetical protein n=1 Tax=Burkholderia glumae TaxID=337 RepID=UPI0012FD6975|nr:hypothetical protein [Burkholderia glumae]QHE11787.1 hypothetical protein GQR88_16155 [Burkholderia glumae AU6208]
MKIYFYWNLDESIIDFDMSVIAAIVPAGANIARRIPGARCLESEDPPWAASLIAGDASLGAPEACTACAGKKRTSAGPRDSPVSGNRSAVGADIVMSILRIAFRTPAF